MRLEKAYVPEIQREVPREVGGVILEENHANSVARERHPSNTDTADICVAVLATKTFVMICKASRSIHAGYSDKLPNWKKVFGLYRTNDSPRRRRWG